MREESQSTNAALILRFLTIDWYTLTWTKSYALVQVAADYWLHEGKMYRQSTDQR